MRCDACGAVTDPVWRWCPVCGAELPGAPGREEEAPASPPAEQRAAGDLPPAAVAFAVEWSLTSTARALVA